LSLKRNLRIKNIAISKAFVKYGYEHFSLIILENCEEDMLLERENFFIKALQPEYNIIKVNSSTVAREITAETSQKRSLARKNYLAKSGYKLADYCPVLADLNKARAKPIKVLNLTTNSEKIYESISQARQELKIDKQTIKKYIENKKVYKNMKFSWLNTPSG
jgi:5-bromo-4-chloroindolyl phosphate hydrolysis protein